MTPRRNSYQSTPEIKNEDTPLLRSNNYGRRNRSCCSLCGCLAVVLLVGAIGGSVLVVLHSQSKEAQRTVHKNADGDYYVTYPTPLDPNSTFVELAQRMLPPWYQASQRVVDTVFVEHKLKPSNVGSARKVLLVTRSLLDAFSPVFPKHSLWKSIRKQFKEGYELVGYLQDLDHSGVDYTKDLLEKRKKDVLDWKNDFLRFNQENNVTAFLVEGEDPDLCQAHKSSHLFWSEVETLPCGHDLASKSLQRLGKVQLANAANYWDTARLYTSVVKEKHEEEFHNLRKELRIFLDEHDLFGEVLLSNPNQDDLDTLFKAQTMLGDINDKWTAYDIYATHGTHPNKQEKLETEIDDQWSDFCAWAQKNDLAGVMQSVLGMLDQLS